LSAKIEQASAGLRGPAWVLPGDGAFDAMIATVIMRRRAALLAMDGTWFEASPSDGVLAREQAAYLTISMTGSRTCGGCRYLAGAVFGASRMPKSIFLPTGSALAVWSPSAVVLVPGGHVRRVNL
jgi:hypothetical protein